MAIVVERFAIGGFDENQSYLLSDDATQQALLVDPAGDIESVLSSIAERSLTLDAIFLTHSDQDHWDALNRVLALKLVPVFAHPDTLAVIGIDGTAVNAENTLALGDAVVSVIETPGHTPDSLCLYVDSGYTRDGVPHLISGDTLFIDGCGRTSPQAAPALYESLQRLKTLPPSTVVHPGHDYGPRPEATLGEQAETNRFLRAMDYETFYRERFPDSPATA